MNRMVFSFMFSLVVVFSANMNNVQAAGTESVQSKRVACDVNADFEMAGIANPDSVGVFLETLGQAIETDNKGKFASLIRYPFRLYDNGQVVKTYNSEKSFLADFDSVVSPGVRSAILSARCADIFVNSQGAMIGRGEVWFDGWGAGNQPGGPIRIKTINP